MYLTNTSVELILLLNKGDSMKKLLLALALVISFSSVASTERHNSKCLEAMTRLATAAIDQRNILVKGFNAESKILESALGNNRGFGATHRTAADKLNLRNIRQWTSENSNKAQEEVIVANVLVEEYCE